MKHTIATLTAAAAFAAFNAYATPQTFDLKDPKGVSHVAFLLDAPLETISGTANGVSGTITIDKENPEQISGKIVLATESLHVPNPMMKEHMLGDEWMNVAEFKEITFEPTSLENLKVDGNKATADVKGKMTIKGVTKEITAPVEVTLLEGRLGERNKGQEGDLLVLRGQFKIKRSDFGINPDAPTDKVADEILLTLNLAGASPKN